MKYLLDTQVFLWTAMRTDRIKRKVWDMLRDPNNELYLSSVSAWEIAIKTSIGKLSVPGDPVAYVPRRARESNLLWLPISPEHALAIHSLPLHHADPFDRMLVAQSQLEGMTIISSDAIFGTYDVRCLTIA